MKLAGKHVTLLGLGRHGGGLGAARHLIGSGARLTISDAATAEELAAPIAALAGSNVARWSLGGHDEDDFRQADIVVVNPAVRPGNPYVELARNSGAAITSEIELFMSACPGRLIGVTGTCGKSSTATMLASILEAEGRKTWLGGNLGGSLLDHLPQMRAAHEVVVELSSFQLFWLTPGARLPDVSVVTNFTPNHLDWHPTLEHYAAAKQRILGRSGFGEHVVLGGDPTLATWKDRLLPDATLACAGDDLPALGVQGPHQRENAACAAAAARLCGCSSAAIEKGLAEFRGLPHRLQFVGEIQGRRFFNDSKSTTPAATRAAVEAFDSPVWLLAGGLDKGCDWGQALEVVVKRVRGAVFYGTSAPALFDRVARLQPGFRAACVGTLAEALEAAWSFSAPGDVIVLSPGSASFDQFRGYDDRGDAYVQLVRELGRRV